MDLLFIKNITELEYAINNSLHENKLLIPIAFDVEYKAHALGLKTNPIWDYDNKAEFTEVFQREDDIINTLWYGFFKNHKYKQFMNVCLFELVLFVDETLFANIYIEKIIEIESPENIYCFIDKQLPCMEKKWECGVFCSTLEYLCEINKINLHLLENPIIRHYEKDYEHRFNKNILLKIFTYSYNTIIYLPILFYALIKSHLFRKRLAINNMALSDTKLKYNYFFEEFVKKEKIRIINSQDRIFKIIHNNIFYSALLSILKIVARLQIRRFSTRFRKYFMEFDNNVFTQPNIFYQWDYLIHSTIENIIFSKIEALYIYFIFKPKYIFLSYEHFVKTISYSIIYKNLNVSTILIPHSIFPYSYKSLYQNYDIVLAFGKYQSNLFLKYGIDNRKIYMLGNAKNIFLMSGFDKNDLKAKYSLKSKKIITVVTGDIQTSAGYFPKWEYKLSPKIFFKFIKACVTLSDLGTEYQIIFKCHPYSDYYELYNMLKKSNISCYSKEPISDFLRISELVIIIDAYSTVILEAAVHHKHIIYCNTGINQDLLNELKYGIIVVNEPNELKNIVIEHFNNRSDVKESELVIERFL
jgi:hypothetical protein